MNARYSPLSMELIIAELENELECREMSKLEDEMQELGWIKRERYDALQALLDAVMLEYCPDEMTPEQRARWAESQAASPDRGDEKHG
jgi:hypothetical protein